MSREDNQFTHSKGRNGILKKQIQALLAAQY
jgi:hypothetical protein